MDETRRQALRSVARVLQIIVASMVIGPLILAGTTFAVVDRESLHTEISLLSLGVIAVGFGGIAASFVLPIVLATSMRRRIAAGTSPTMHTSPALADLGEDGKLLMGYQAGLLVGCAALEGPAFFGLIATIIDGSLIALAIAVICLLILATRFPTAGGLQEWLQRQHRAMEEDRMFQR